MTIRYAAVPKAFWDETPSAWTRDDIRLGNTMQLVSSEPYSRDTGLLDLHGNKIVAIVEPSPIGFNK